MLLFVLWALSSCVTIRSELALPSYEGDVTGLVLVSHGYGNNPTHWPRKLIGQIENRYRFSDDWRVYAHDWSANSDRVLTASTAGYRIGRGMADSVLAAGDRYSVIHLVGHSMGAWVAQGFADTYRRRGGRAVIQMTLLDPFHIRGIFGVGWGVRNFGRNTDYAESYIVRNEPVLGTNRYLRKAHNFDVTAAVPASMWEISHGPHWWVVEYYRISVGRLEPGFSLSPMVLSGNDDLSEIRPLLTGLARVFPAGDVTLIRPEERRLTLQVTR